MMSRRDTLLGVGAVAGLLAGVRGMFSIPPAHAARAYEVVHSPAEWQKLLQPAQYNVLRQAGTERPGSSPLNKEKRAGVFSCAGCALPVFSSATKFESGTGWPSFFNPVVGAISLHEDGAFGVKRVEVRSVSSGIHLGHVFDDGPPPSHKRYCINGNVLKFVPDAGS